MRTAPLATRLTPQPELRRTPAARVVGRRVELVVNANASGAGGAADVMARAKLALEAVGAEVNARLTADERQLADALRAANGRRLVLVGGDGTVHALANLDIANLPPTALLPAGRANNIARALGIPLDWGDAARLAIWGRPTPVDALRVVTPGRSLFAVEGVSAGFHAAARHRYRGTNSADLSAGVRALVDELRAFRPFPATLGVDGATLVDRPVAQAFVSNLPYFGFGFHVDPVADWSDGNLEAIVLDARSRRDVLRSLHAARAGRHLDRTGTIWRRGREARFDTPLPLVADAQPLGVTTATVTVVQGRLRLIAGEAT
jgi:diacylglycerol kinase family enzyme